LGDSNRKLTSGLFLEPAGRIKLTGRPEGGFPMAPLSKKKIGSTPGAIAEDVTEHIPMGRSLLHISLAKLRSGSLGPQKQLLLRNRLTMLCLPKRDQPLLGIT
jgi:hypothetical protein